MAEFKKVITNKGQELITAAAFDSGELAVKYIVIGDANGESYEPSEEQTVLVNQRNKLLITERIVNSPTRYTFLVQIPQDIDYYIIREIGLVDENDNLIEIAQMEQETYIQSDNLVQQLTIGIQIDVGQSSTVIVLADTNIETASKDFVNNNFQNLNQKGQANGYCGLDDAALIPLTHIPEIYADRELNNLSDFGNARLQFNPFQINNGTVNADGLNATLYKSTDTTLTCDPCTITTADGRTKEFTSTANYVVSSTPITKDVTWVQPVLSSNGTMGGSSFAVRATAHSGTNDAWKAFDNNNSTMYEVGNGQSPHLYMYNPKPLKVTAISVSSSSYPLRQFEVRASNDFSNWVVLTSGTASGNSYTISLSNNNNYYKYYDLHQTSSEGKNIQTIRLTAKYQETVSDADGTYYVLKNFEDGSLSLCKKLYYTDIENPASLTTGDYWLYTNKAPWSFKTYDGTDWQNANNMVAIGKVKIASGVITSVTNYKFNVAAWSSLWHTYGISKSASWFLPAVVVENYVSGTSWYRVWSDGWIEQGGKTASGTNQTITLLKSFTNTNYCILTSQYYTSSSNGDYGTVKEKTKSNFTIPGYASMSYGWYACGY